MFFFKTKYKTDHTQQAPSPRLLQKANALLAQYAVYLQQQACRLSLRRLRFSLFLFCLLSGCICGWIIVSSFKQKETRVLKITPIRLPVHAIRNGDETNSTRNSLTENKCQQVQTWRHVLDSLRRKALYDRFCSSQS